jgi:L-threonylcarbamoyladenylate synthase
VQTRFVQTRIEAIDPDRPDGVLIKAAAAILRGGGLVAFATETVYGLGAVANDPEAVARIFAAKGRPSFNPLIVHVADVDQARALVTDWPEIAHRLAEIFWPGPLTLVLPKSDAIPDVVTAGQGTVGIRIPAPRVARDLIRFVGSPIAAPSANRSNRISPTRAEHVRADLDGRIEMILDSGPAAVGLESTVVDLTGDVPTILRPGPITARMIEDALGVRSVGYKEKPEEPLAGLSSPGQLPVHYAPKTQAVRIEPSDSLEGTEFPNDIAVLDLSLTRDPRGLELSPFVSADFETPEQATRRLYDVLHRFDDLAPDLIVIRMPPDLPEWSAVRDRLQRATISFSTWRAGGVSPLSSK